MNQTFAVVLCFRIEMKGTTFRRKMKGWRCFPGGNWSQTGTAMRSQRDRSLMMTCLLREEQTTTYCWSQQVRSGLDTFEKVVFVLLAEPVVLDRPVAGETSQASQLIKTT